MEPRLIDHPDTFRALLDEVAHSPIIALDTEAASFHRYYDRIYLIQLSTRTTTAVIDPLSVGDLAPIGVLLANATVEKVFHDADYDLRLFDKEFGFHCHHVFDTRVAAQFLNEPGIGLGALLEKYFGVRPDKRFQRADWSLRPLSAPMLEYAAGDTDHLCELRDILLEKLADMDRLSWVDEEFERVEGTRWTGELADPTTDFLRIKGAHALDRRALARLRELAAWRAEVAAGLDRAEFRVVGNETLLYLAEHPVSSIDELSRVRGVGRDILARRGGEIVDALARANAVPEADLPRFPRSPRRAADPAFDARLVALKNERNRLATALELAPGVLCPNGTLEAIARAEPEDVDDLAAIPDVRRWQRSAIGAALVAAMHTAYAASDNKEQ